MLKLLADENIPKKLIRLVSRDVDIIRLQDIGGRGLSDSLVIELANTLGRTIFTRDSDFTRPEILSRVRNGVMFLAWQPNVAELVNAANMVVEVSRLYNAKPGLLIIINRFGVEVYGAD